MLLYLKCQSLTLEASKDDVLDAGFQELETVEIYRVDKWDETRTSGPGLVVAYTETGRRRC
jgi:hypothetical protein